MYSPAWNWRLFENWGEFFELAITGVLMTSLEMWAFEISVFLAG
jgi:MATE family multidrug resistance protein